MSQSIIAIIYLCILSITYTKLLNVSQYSESIFDIYFLKGNFGFCKKNSTSTKLQAFFKVFFCRKIKVIDPVQDSKGVIGRICCRPHRRNTPKRY